MDLDPDQLTDLVVQVILVMMAVVLGVHRAVTRVRKDLREWLAIDEIEKAAERLRVIIDGNGKPSVVAKLNHVETAQEAMQRDVTQIRGDLGKVRKSISRTDTHVASVEAYVIQLKMAMTQMQRAIDAARREAGS